MTLFFKRPINSIVSKLRHAHCCVSKSNLRSCVSKTRVGVKFKWRNFSRYLPCSAGNTCCKFKDTQYSCICFIMQTRPNILLDLVFASSKQKQDLCVSLLFAKYRYIFQYGTQNSAYIRQSTLFFVIPELIPMYTLVLEYKKNRI